MAAITRLGLYGGTRSLYGDFSTKEEGVVVVVAVVPSGGFMMDFDVFRKRRDEEEEKRKRVLKEIKALKDETDREIAQLLQQDIAVESRQDEITELQQIVARNATAQDLAVTKAHNDKIARAFVRAAVQKNFSAVEALEREMDRKFEEDEFLMLALVVLR